MLGHKRVYTEKLSTLFLGRSTMNPFECCRKCVAPKRHPGCGSTCPEYQEARTKWEALKATIKKEKEKEEAIHLVRSRSGPFRRPKE